MNSAKIEITYTPGTGDALHVQIGGSSVFGGNGQFNTRDELEWTLQSMMRMVLEHAFPEPVEGTEE